MAFHSGFVCILGRPNAGKSTLLNALVGEKLAIISPKPQTTRNRILGIIHVPRQKGRLGGQIVLIDTPGVHRPDTSLGRKMMAEVREAMVGGELVLLIADVTRRFTREDHFVLDLAKKSGTPVFLLLNKIDLLRGTKKKSCCPSWTSIASCTTSSKSFHSRREDAKASTCSWKKCSSFFRKDRAIFRKTRSPTSLSVSWWRKSSASRFWCRPNEEVPYATTVMIEQFEEGARVTRIAAVIYCEREGQKGILVGKGGQMLKKIGTAARLQIEKMLEQKVFLELFVKVRENWRESHEFVEELDWRRRVERLAAGSKP